MAVNRQSFFNLVRPLFGGRLKPSQVAGMSAILDEWDRRDPTGDLRWLAYMLATSFHETAREMLPVREAYWLSEEWRRRNLARYYPYYGRGYVQLTWAANYAKAGAYVGADLVRQPDLALRPDIAAAIMFVGMREGWFRADRQGRRHTLARHFGHNVNDPVGARDIINGREVKNGVVLATTIARYHASFLSALGQRSFAAPPFDAIAAATSNGAGLAAPMEAYASFVDGSETAFDAQPSPAAPEAEVADLVTLPAEGSSKSRTLELTAQIVAGYVSANPISHTSLPDLIASVHAALEDTVAPFGRDGVEADDNASEEGVDLEGGNPEDDIARLGEPGSLGLPQRGARTPRPEENGATAA